MASIHTTKSYIVPLETAFNGFGGLLKEVFLLEDIGYNEEIGIMHWSGLTNNSAQMPSSLTIFIHHQWALLPFAVKTTYFCFDLSNYTKNVHLGICQITQINNKFPTIASSISPCGIDCQEQGQKAINKLYSASRCAQIPRIYYIAWSMGILYLMSSGATMTSRPPRIAI